MSGNTTRIRVWYTPLPDADGTESHSQSVPGPVEQETTSISVESTDTLALLRFKLYCVTSIIPSHQVVSLRDNSGGDAKADNSPGSGSKPSSQTLWTGNVMPDAIASAGISLKKSTLKQFHAFLHPSASALQTHADSVCVVVQRTASRLDQKAPDHVANLVQALAQTLTSEIPHNSQSTCSKVFVGKSAVEQPGMLDPATKRPICLVCAKRCKNGRSDLLPRLTDSPFVCQCNNTSASCTFARQQHDKRLSKTGPYAMQLKQQCAQFLAQHGEESRTAMQRRIMSYLMSMRPFESKDWKDAALSVIPVDSLHKRAAERHHSMVKEAKEAVASDDTKAQQQEKTPEPLAEQDCLLLELLHWFKNDFFSWVDQPPCDACGAETVGKGRGEPSPQERKYFASVIELYECKVCRSITRFPRYNHAPKLLETRRGRCGEWTQAFYLCCRAMGFDARTAYDFTDHVWVEVWSDAEARWIHADPCENVRDGPLMYDVGWGKKLTYVIAVSDGDVADVTKRYVLNWPRTLQRRVLCGEQWLASLITSLQLHAETRMPSQRADICRARRAEEARELELHHTGNDRANRLTLQEQQGRQTGNFAWRVSRGEAGRSNM
jgi:Transglutaminase-like superfamily